jgi:DNA replication protein DnaC
MSFGPELDWRSVVRIEEHFVWMRRQATVPLLIIDDLGMRKVPVTAAEELLEIVMRRHERTSYFAHLQPKMLCTAFRFYAEHIVMQS